MYSSARSAAAWSDRVPNEAGSGTLSVTGTTWSGVVPQVTYGTSSPPSISSRLSYSAPSSVGSVRQ